METPREQIKAENARKWPRGYWKLTNRSVGDEFTAYDEPGNSYHFKVVAKAAIGKKQYWLAAKLDRKKNPIVSKYIPALWFTESGNEYHSPDNIYGRSAYRTRKT